MNIVPILASCTSTATAPMNDRGRQHGQAITRLNRSIRSTSGGFPAPAAVIEIASRPDRRRARLPRPRRARARARSWTRQTPCCGSRPVPRRRGQSSSVLQHCQRFAGQQRLVDLQAVRIEQPQVRRHPLPALERNHIARHDLRGCRVPAIRRRAARSRESTAASADPGSAAPRATPATRRAPELISSITPMNPASPTSPSSDRGHGRGQQDIDQRTLRVAASPTSRIPGGGLVGSRFGPPARGVPLLRRGQGRSRIFKKAEASSAGNACQ